MILWKLCVFVFHNLSLSGSRNHILVISGLDFRFESQQCHSDENSGIVIMSKEENDAIYKINYNSDQSIIPQSFNKGKKF